MDDSTPALTRADIVARLRRAGCVYAEEEAALLLAETRRPGGTAEPAGRTPWLAGAVAQRVEGIPLEYILGWAEFCGLRIAVEPGVFVPRLRTSALVREASVVAGLGMVVVDLCCGTGAVGAALLAARPELHLTVHAADLDPVAVRCALRNLGETGRVYQGDLYDALPRELRGQVDVLVVNAPYVPSDAIKRMPHEARDHEARLALDGGEDGLDVHRRVAAGATDWLAPGAHVLIETSEAQARGTSTLLARAGLATRTAHHEEFDGTVVVGTRA